MQEITSNVLGEENVEVGVVAMLLTVAATNLKPEYWRLGSATPRPGSRNPDHRGYVLKQSTC
jgi:hypothetical protein